MRDHALLGGSFDPIHNGHLHVARQILRAGIVRSVVFLPNARHNFKGGRVLQDYDVRHELVESALEPGMEVWDDDSTGSGYTSDLMRRLYQKYPNRTFFWVIGSDNLAHLRQWHDFPWLRRNVRFLVIPRPGHPLEEKILKRIHRKTLRIEPSPISSTLVRKRISKGEPITGLVPEKIEQRVIELYRP
ncbi:MAG: nicotinate (nicotinamide) nucleotide adenylyltransferase, partial [Candidatus Syntrophosphaera sp.]